MCRSASDGGRRCPGDNAPDGFIQPSPEELAAYQASLAAERAEAAQHATHEHAGARTVYGNTGNYTQGDNSPVAGTHNGDQTGRDW